MEIWEATAGGSAMQGEDKVAAELYRSFGFSETGEMDGEELIAILKM